MSSSSSSCNPHANLRWILPMPGSIPINTPIQFSLIADDVCCDPKWATWPAGSPATGTGMSLITEWAESSLGNQIIASSGAAFVTLLVDVVKLGELTVSVPSVGFNIPESGRAPSTIYVTKGQSLTFGVTPDPVSANWPSGKPAWNGGEPDELQSVIEFLGLKGRLQRYTFNTVGDQTVSVECGNTRSVAVKVGLTSVGFSSSEARPGVGNTKKHTLGAKCRIVDALGENLTVDLSTDNARATVSPASFILPAGSTEKDVSVVVTGVSLSGADRDTNVIAKVNGTTVGTLPVTVVEPKRYTIVPRVTSGQWTAEGSRVYSKCPTEITVLDQFDRPLASPFNGAHMQERVQLTPNGAYEAITGLDGSSSQNWSPLVGGKVTDHVVSRIELPNATTAARVANGEIVYPTFPERRGPYNLKFFIDGQQLDGVTERFSVLHRNSETVTNVIK